MDFSSVTLDNVLIAGKVIAATIEFVGKLFAILG